MKFLEIAKKDLRAEFRTKQMLNSMVIFALLVMVIFSFSFGNEVASIYIPTIKKNIIDILAPGMLWIAFTFAGMLGLSRSFAGEKEEGCLDGLKLCPVDRSDIYNGKVLSNAVLMFLMEIAALPIFIFLFNYDIKNLPGLILVIILGTFGFIFVGTLLSALTVNTRTREILLPVILFPVLIPVILSAVTATATMLSNGNISDISGQLQILVVYDIIFFVVAQIVFEYTIED
jgi:heme exporter protein B